jgi:hypothetical protein
VLIDLKWDFPIELKWIERQFMLKRVWVRNRAPRLGVALCGAARPLRLGSRVFQLAVRFLQIGEQTLISSVVRFG